MASDLPRTLVWGILNVTPDSFSDGGRFLDPANAIAQGLELARAGADVIDVGGESTRPGAARVSAEEEQRRVLPVIEALTSQGIAVSCDTMRASTAACAVSSGATIINDVSGGLADPEMAAAVADTSADFVAMHWRGHAGEMDTRDTYDDVVAEVHDELAQRLDALTSAGIDRSRIILDPGLGFAKVTESNWPLLARIDEWSAGQRVLIGASRKRFLGAAIARHKGDMPGPSERDHATTAVTTLAAHRRVWAVRVHDARAARDAIDVVSAWICGANRTR